METDDSKDLRPTEVTEPVENVTPEPLELPTAPTHAPVTGRGMPNHFKGVMTWFV
jgi:hypothetical protein